MKRLLTSLLIGASVLAPIQTQARNTYNWQIDEECVTNEYTSDKTECYTSILENTPANFNRVIRLARSDREIFYGPLLVSMNERDIPPSSEFMYENAQFTMNKLYEDVRLYLTNAGDVYWCSNRNDCTFFDVYSLNYVLHLNLDPKDEALQYHTLEEVEGQCALVATHSTEYKTKSHVTAITRWKGGC